MNKDFAANVRAARARADLSQTDVAEKIGVNVGTIVKYENGDMTPGADKIVPLASALGCTPNDLLGWGN